MIFEEQIVQEVVCVSPPVIESLELNDIKWLLADNPDGGKLIGLSEDGYRKLAENTSKTLEYIKKLILFVRYYKTCISDHNAKAE